VDALKETQNAARKAGVQVTSVQARTPNDIVPGFEKIAATHPGALVILNSVLMSGQASRNAELALQLKLPAVYPDPRFAKAGGFMSYGANVDSTITKLATYIDRIFKGAKPGDFPVEQQSKFELIINLNTVKALGLETLNRSSPLALHDSPPRPGLLLWSAQSLAARLKREHQWPAASVLSERNRLLAHLSELSERACPAAQSMSAKDLGLRNASR